MFPARVAAYFLAVVPQPGLEKLLVPSILGKEKNTLLSTSSPKATRVDLSDIQQDS